MDFVQGIGMGRSANEVGVFGNALELLPSVCLLVFIHAALRHFHRKVVLVDTVESIVSKNRRFGGMAYDAGNAITTFECQIVYEIDTFRNYETSDTWTEPEATCCDASHVFGQC